jgi:ribosomal protein L31E
MIKKRFKLDEVIIGNIRNNFNTRIWIKNNQYIINKIENFD